MNKNIGHFSSQVFFVTCFVVLVNLTHGQDLLVDGNLQVEGVARIDGGADIAGGGLAVYSDEAAYENGDVPVLEISSSGVVTGDLQFAAPLGNLSMGAFVPVPITYLDLSAMTVGIYNSASFQDGTNGNPSQITFSANGYEATIGTNSWKTLSFSYQVVASTVLTFEFRSDDPGEMFGVGLETDDNIASGPTMMFLIGGTQSVSATSTRWLSDYRDYTIGEGWKKYTIPVGQYFTGQINYIALVCDEDQTGSSAEALYRNISVSD